MKSIKQLSLKLYFYKKYFLKLTGIKLNSVSGVEIINRTYEYYSSVSDEKKLEDRKKLLYDKEDNDTKELIPILSVVISILFTFLCLWLHFQQII